MDYKGEVSFLNQHGRACALIARKNNPLAFAGPQGGGEEGCFKIRLTLKQPQMAISLPEAVPGRYYPVIRRKTFNAAAASCSISAVLPSMLIVPE
jgi:hypothetical protein